jgi:hypothetical protein
VATQKQGRLAGVALNGAAVLSSGYGVALVNGDALWAHHAEYASVFDADGSLDDTYPGYLPHITLAEKVDSYSRRENLLLKVAEYSKDDNYFVGIDGVYLRAGRTALPLWT